MKNPDGSKSWVIDEKSAAVVRRIGKMYDEGVGSDQIAIALENDKILTPLNYLKSKGVNRPGKSDVENPYHWNSSTIVKILNTQEYCGDVINFKTYSKSYKNKKRYKNDEENIVVFKDVHPAIWDRALFERIQSKRKKIRRKTTTKGERNMFSGLVVCADCGSNLGYHFNQGNPKITYFNCMGYNRGSRKICNSTHYIRTDFLEQVVLGEIRRMTKFATQYENEFAKIVMGNSIKSAERQRQAK